MDGEDPEETHQKFHSDSMKIEDEEESAAGKLGHQEHRFGLNDILRWGHTSTIDDQSQPEDRLSSAVECFSLGSFLQRGFGLNPQGQDSNPGNQRPDANSAQHLDRISSLGNRLTLNKFLKREPKMHLPKPSDYSTNSSPYKDRRTFTEVIRNAEALPHSSRQFSSPTLRNLSLPHIFPSSRKKSDQSRHNIGPRLMKELPRIDDPQRRPSYRTETPPNSKGNSEPNLHPLSNARHMREGSKAHRAPMLVELMKWPGDGKEGKDHSEQGVMGGIGEFSVGEYEGDECSGTVCQEADVVRGLL